MSLKPVAVDALEWIEAVAKAVDDFQVTLRTQQEAGADDDIMPFLHDYAEFLGEMADLTEDDSMRQYLQANLAKVVKQARKLQA